jgi:hypothetical protein
LNLAELTTLSGVNRETRHLICDHLRGEFDINQKLTPFVDDPVAFRSQLGQSNAYIIGEFALAFFQQGQKGPKVDTLEILVHSENASGLFRHLKEKEGWVLDPSRTEEAQREFSDDANMRSPFMPRRLDDWRVPHCTVH